jgi:tRNA(fMet)-specific endonuclease VapC
VTLRYLLDTAIVSNPMSQKPNAEILRQLEDRSDECAIASLVWHELVFGWQRLPVGKRKDALEAYLDHVVLQSFPILEYTEPAATWHGQERARLDAEGRSAPFVDGQIAAIAYANGLILVTPNVKDFDRFSDLEVLDWSKRSRR